MKRCRRNVNTVSIFASVLSASWLIPSALSYDRNVSNYQTNTGQQFINQECSGLPRQKRTVQVRDVSLLCDAGENSEYTYEDRVVCLSGDTAKAEIAFELYSKNSLTELYIDIEARVLGKRVYVQNRTSLCNLDDVTYWGETDDSSGGDDRDATTDASPCPVQDGEFLVLISFTVPYTSNDARLTSTPDLRVRFYDDSSNKIGCVETGDLAKVTFSRSMERRGQRFFLLSVLLLCLLISFCLLGHQRRRQRQERAAVNKRASIMRRFHYIQTTQSGEVQMTTSPSLQQSFSRGSADFRGVRPSTIVENRDDSSSASEVGPPEMDELHGPIPPKPRTM